jgi:hypothetical protein
MPLISILVSDFFFNIWGINLIAPFPFSFSNVYMLPIVD